MKRVSEASRGASGSNKRRSKQKVISSPYLDARARGQEEPPSLELRDSECSRSWTTADSDKTYAVSAWGWPYFSINEQGNIGVDVGEKGGGKKKIDLYKMVESLLARGHDMPLLIRFSDILQDRIRILNEAFASAITDHEYTGLYRGVFPVKVCQQAAVVKEIVKYGAPFKYGLEAGSKPELLIVLAHLTTPGAIITCNGYKDTEYIETALLAQHLGQIPIIIIEKLHEIDLCIQASTKLGIKPRLGVRVKLTAKGVGRWSHSSGEQAKFGLSSADIMEAIRKLKAAKMLESLELLHFHIGSQLSEIAVVKDALREASAYYVQLHALTASMKYIDIGGGLAIDYDGSKTRNATSMNYTMEEYAADVVSMLKTACDRKGVPHPTIVSESGRAICSHQTVLVYNVLGSTTPSQVVRSDQPVEPSAGDSQSQHNLFDTLKSVNRANLQECYHDAQQYLSEAVALFNMGMIGLPERANCEELYWRICKTIAPLANQLKQVPDELVDLQKSMSHIYYCNFSVFRSAPDSWAIDQLFPIVPIHRLNEEPTQLATLVDITCDSDGKIDKFISLEEDMKDQLEVHPLIEDQPYFIGMFLGGAYQEVLGNLHNLFGDTNCVHVTVDEDDEDGYQIDHVIIGERNDQVLGYMEYSPPKMVERIRRQSERALKAKTMTMPQYKNLMRHYERMITRYTYLWCDES